MSSMTATARLARLGKNGRRAKNYEDLEGVNHFQCSSEQQRLRAADVLGHMDFDATANEIEMSAAAVASAVIADDTFSVDQAVNALGFGRFQIKLSLVTGLCWMADSMEMMILSIISSALHCSWGIRDWQQALITTIVFLGMMISATFWGFVSDKHGRKKALLLSAIMLSYYGVLSAFAPNYVWILVLRGLVGFAVGCVPQAVTLYAEFLPISQRAKCIVLLECFWALGACFEVGLALFVMPNLGWRWLLGLSAIPVIIFTLVSFWLPESVRYDASAGNVERAINTLKRIAKDNGKLMPAGRFMLDDVQEVKRGRIIDLFIPELRLTTLLLWFIWTVCAFCYYGLVLMTTELFRSPTRCGGTSNGAESTCHANCQMLKTNDYVDLLWTTMAEFPGIFVTIFIIELLGRKLTMAAEFIVTMIFIFLLFICSLNRTMLTVILFGARGIVSGVFQAVYVYTPECTLTNCSNAS